MGKKSRVKTQKSGTAGAAVVSPKEMMNLISELLQSKSQSNLSSRVDYSPAHFYVLILFVIPRMQRRGSVSGKGVGGVRPDPHPGGENPQETERYLERTRFLVVFSL